MRPSRSLVQPRKVSMVGAPSRSRPNRGGDQVAQPLAPPSAARGRVLHRAPDRTDSRRERSRARCSGGNCGEHPRRLSGGTGSGHDQMRERIAAERGVSENLTKSSAMIIPRALAAEGSLIGGVKAVRWPWHNSASARSTRSSVQRNSGLGFATPRPECGRQVKTRMTCGTGNTLRPPTTPARAPDTADVHAVASGSGSNGRRRQAVAPIGVRRTPAHAYSDSGGQRGIGRRLAAIAAGNGESGVRVVSPQANADGADQRRGPGDLASRRHPLRHCRSIASPS